MSFLESLAPQTGTVAALGLGASTNSTFISASSGPINMKAAAGTIYPIFTLPLPAGAEGYFQWQFFPAYFVCAAMEVYSGNLNTPQINIGFRSSGSYSDFASNQNLTKPQGGALSGMFASGQYDLFAPRTPAAGQFVMRGANTTLYVRINVASDATVDTRCLTVWGYLSKYWLVAP